MIASYSFKHPFTCMVAGPTSSGKTVLVESIIDKHKLLIPKLKSQPRIVWCYGQWQSRYAKNKKIEYHEGLVDQPQNYDLIIIDDLMNELGEDNRLLNLFTKGSHHMNLSIIFIVQNVFHQAKNMRNISLNCHYLILMKNPRDKAQIYALARQLYPTKIAKFVAAYEDATVKPFSYIKVDLTPSTPEELRVRTNIVPKSKTHTLTVYQI